MGVRLPGLSVTLLLAALALPAAATAAPEDLTADYDADSHAIVLSWGAVPAPSPNPTTYTVYRNGVSLGTTTDTTFSDALSANPLPEIWEYTVTATIAGSESLPSASILIAKGLNPLDPRCPMFLIVVDQSPPNAAVIPRWECIPP